MQLQKKDIDESKFDIVEKITSNNKIAKTAYNVVDIGSGLASLGSGIKQVGKHLKDGGRIVDMAFDSLKAKKTSA